MSSELICVVLSADKMGSNALPDDILDSSEDELQALKEMDSSEDELQALEQMNVGFLECEGIPRPMWNTKYATLYNLEGVLVGEGTCDSVNSELVFGAHGRLGDTHVSMHVSKTHSEVDFIIITNTHMSLKIIQRI